MSTPSFSRPGAVDLSALKRPAGSPAGSAPGAAPGSVPGGGTAGTGAYSVELNEQNFQAEMQGTTNAPVVLVFYSAQMPASVTLADDLDILADEFEGRFLLGRVDVDAAPSIAQALQIPSVPLVALAMGGQLAPLLQDAPPLEELRALMGQVLQAATAQGMTGRVQPRGTAAPAQTEDGEEQVDPRYAPAQDALADGDVDRAVAEYQKLVDANPADAEAAAGLAMAKVLQRTVSADPNQVRTAAAERPDDVEAQTLAADLDLLGGHVDDAFGRLIDLVRRTSGDERDQARTHLLGLFAAVGNEDPRVLKGRQNLANALF
jgi:putative thioredoxin